ncbi:MAG: glycoside hydrolase family 88 protein [Clostridiales bacterium]|nr:glycoside hydrolase family 88 protein [Clostridiales bacterium]
MDYTKHMDFAVEKTRENIKIFKYGFPMPQSRDYNYAPEACVDWTSGFFPGMEMIAYEYTKDEEFLKSARFHAEIFRHRIDNKIAVNHHDMGFLYSLACVSIYKVKGDEFAKETALLGADQLMERYNPVGRFIQAWGNMHDDTNNRLIIDCLLNIPLLYWASEVTGDEKYKNAANAHLDTTLKVIIRDNNTTYHTYFFDKKTGEPVRGQTAQGYSDDSCWARGQAWGVYGAALAYHYTKNEALFDFFNRVTSEFIKRLPSDYVPYWDMVFSDGSDEPRDTSAAAVACCGILEMSKYMDCSKYLPYVDKMMESLGENYTSKRLSYPSNVILTDGMYSRPDGHKPEGTIFGDYFYMEALMRLINPDWHMYW